MNKERILKAFPLVILALLLAAMTIAASVYGTYKSSDEEETQDLRILMAGDLMCQYRQQEAAFDGDTFDFDYAFDHVRSILQNGDLVIGNLETNICASLPLSMKTNEKCYYDPETGTNVYKPYLNAPKEYLKALKNAGFNVLVNANNHNCDAGVAGIRETIAAQDEYSFLHTGLFDGKTSEKRYLLLEMKGIKIGLASYATYFNLSESNLTEKEREACLNKYSAEQVKKDIKAMEAEGAEFVIIYFHCGTEYTHMPSNRQLIFAQEIADAGADYIICSHSHTVQKYDILQTVDDRRVPVYYAAGNFISHMSRHESNQALIAGLTLEKIGTKVRIKSEEYYPCVTLGKTEEGKRYQVVPCTMEEIKTFQSGKIKEYLNKSRELIKKHVGKKIQPL